MKDWRYLTGKVTVKTRSKYGAKKVKADAILTREGYVVRIHDCYRGQGMSIATHDVLMHHDAALRAQVERLTRERDIEWADKCSDLADKCVAAEAERDRLLALIMNKGSEYLQRIAAAALKRKEKP